MDVFIDENASVLFENIKKIGCFTKNITIDNSLFIIDPIIVTFFLLIFFCILSLFVFIRNFLKYFYKNKQDVSTLIKNILPELSLLIFFGGMSIYYIGYDYQGTGANFLTLIIRSALSSFEMFLSKSNLIGVASNCKDNSLYMFLFAFIHASAVMVSMVFAVACFGKRIKDWIRSVFWLYSSQKTEINIFWGINEKSIILAKDLYIKSNGKDRIVFIDIPNEEENISTGQSFSGIMGLLTYKAVMAKQLSNISYIMLKSSLSPLSMYTSEFGILEDMGLGNLNKLMRKSRKVNYFVLTDNESFNIQVSLKLLDSDIGERIDNLYCSARRTKEISIHGDCRKGGNLHLIDDSRESVMELAMRKDSNGAFYTHPINYVSVNSDLGYVETEFESLIVGFGTTGQDAFRFLYEFSAFPNRNGHKSAVRFFICDGGINMITGDLYQEIPVLPKLEKCGEIEFCPYNFGTVDFYEKLHGIIDKLNYVVIATGNDERNLDIATRIYEFAMQYRKNELDRFRVFVRMYDSRNEYIFKKTIQAYSDLHVAAIEYFGSPNDIYTRKRILDDEEGMLSDKFYKAYCNVSNSKDLQHEDRRKEEVNKESTKLLGYRRLNRVLFQDKANSKHCYTKEILLGLHSLDKCPLLPQWPIVLEGNLSDEINKWKIKLVNVSICEHLRWNASHFMMGYTKMSGNDFKGSSCNEKKRQHLCLVDWEDLPSNPDYKEYDYIVVKTAINLYYELKK